METVILSGESKSDIDLLSMLAEKLGVKTTKVSEDEFEDIALGIAMVKGRTGEYVDTEEFLKKLER